MNHYQYETHLHTKGPSHCAVSTGAEQARYMKELGYTGFVVTDHFFNGNTGIDRRLPWKEWVSQYCAGYEEAKAEGDKIGIDVFFGVEWNFETDEFLLYGVDKEWLHAYPEMLNWSHRELFHQINAIGGAMVQAHPFRIRGYVPAIHLYPELVHGVEVTNACNEAVYDCFAYEYAKYFHLPMTSGSDLHAARPLPRGVRGVSSETKWTSIMDYVRQIKSGAGYEIIQSPDSVGLKGNETLSVPVEMRDSKEQQINDRLSDIFTNEIELLKR